jgi:beta-lactamase class A
MARSEHREVTMRKLAVSAVVCALLPSLVGATDQNLTKVLEGAAARFPGKIGIYVKHLRTGQEAAVGADEAFDSMSVIKLAIMVLAYQMADRGELDLDHRVELKAADRRPGSGILQFHAPGLMPTERDLIIEMVITSDNSATDMLIGRVGGVAAVNQWLTQAGFPKARLLRTTFEWFRQPLQLLDAGAQQLSPEEVYALESGRPFDASRSSALVQRLQRQASQASFWNDFSRRSAEDPASWLGSLTARDIGRLLEQIERATIASKRSCAEMTQFLKWQQSGARRIPHYIDLRVDVGHKTGDFGPGIANDVGVIYLSSGPLVVAFLTSKIHGDYGEAEDDIGRIARTLVEYFDGAPGGNVQ